MSSFLTPPPEFDECIDATGMLKNHTCAIQDLFYPSPSSCSSSISSGHIGAGSSYSPHSPTCRTESSFMDQDPYQPPLFADQHASMQFEHPIPTSQSTNMYNLEAPFGLYDQSTWPSYPPAIAAQYPPLQSGHEEASSFFGAYPPGESSISTLLPPTPQPVTPNGHNIRIPTRMNQSANYLSSLQQHHTFTPDASIASMSNRSRSCSPDASYGDRDGRQRSHVRSGSMASASSPLSHYGIPVRAPGSSPHAAPQAWRCAYPNCTSRATFIRGCDLRKHYNRHSKHLFCRIAGCPQSEAAAMNIAQAQDPHGADGAHVVLSGGFSSKKDRARHEAKHNPRIKCEWHGQDGEECGRLFSRMDNMKDHVRRIHNKGQTASTAVPPSSADKIRKVKKSSR